MDRWILAFLAGHIMALFSPVLLPISLLLVILLLTLFFSVIFRLFLHTSLNTFSTSLIFRQMNLLVNGFISGGVYVMFMSNLYFVNNFTGNDAQDFYIKGEVSSVVVKKEQRHSVTLSIKLDEIDGVPLIKNWYLPATHIRANWFNPSVNLQQGDKLLATIKLSKPHGYQNTFGFDYNQWMFAKRFIATGNIKAVHSNLDYSFTKHRQKYTQQLTTNILINATTGLKHQGIILAVGLGNRSLITSKQFELYNHMGISHLLAISGLHIGIIFLVMKLLLQWLTKRLRIYISYTLLQTSVLLLLWAYIALINFPISATRAALFVSLWVFLNVNFSNINKVKLLLVVALFSLLIDPFSVLTAAWWLTFSAVLGIVLFVQKYPLLQNVKGFEDKENKNDDSSTETKSMMRVVSMINPMIERVALRIMYLMKFQLFITIWMMPVVIFWFGGVSVSGVLTNLIAIPLFSVLLVPCIFLGTLFVMLSDVFFNSYDVSHLLILANDVLTYLIDFFSYYSIFHFWLNIANGLWLYVLLIILLALVSPVYFRRGLQQSIKLKISPMVLVIVLLIPMLLSLLPWQNITENERNNRGDFSSNNTFEKYLQPRLIMYVLDVGQGTSILFQQGNSGFIYDLGPVYPSGFNATQAVVKPMLVGLGVTNIDHVIISHNDSDHIGDINVLGDANWVENRLLNCAQSSFTWLNTQVDVLWPPVSSSGSSSFSGSTGSAFLTRSDINKLSKNDSSCVIKITDDFTGVSVLLTGDITSKIERRLLVMAKNNIVNLTSDILISAHHGSKYSSAMKFINKVAPTKVLHSAGVNNRFGFPTLEVLNRFSSFNPHLSSSLNGSNSHSKSKSKSKKNMEIHTEAQQYSTNKVGMIKVVFDNGMTNDHSQENVTGYLDHWQPFWKKQNPFRFTSEMR